MNAKARARAYLAKLPSAVAGQGGHSATFAAACRLREFGLGEVDALEIISEWNLTHCTPPWSERELRHKISDAFRIAAPKQDFAIALPGKNFPPLQSAISTNSYTPSSRGIANRSSQRPGANVGGNQPNPAKANLYASLFGPAASQSYFSRLATLRGLSVEGIKLAADRGLLRFGTWRTRLAWFILDGTGRVAQVRRLDGQPWAKGVKAWTLPGSQAAWPVGIGEARDFMNVALCEGGPDLLAACAFMVAQRHKVDFAPVAMLGGCARIHVDALPMFAGKRVRIFPHADKTGESAAIRWAAQLVDVGASVDAFSLAGLCRVDGESVKDLCDLAAIDAEDLAARRCLRELFDYGRLN